MSAIPPQRWTGWGYQSDPEVWTSQVMAGEEQYWLGDTLLIGGVYEEGKSVARMYLPTKGDDDEGYLNLNAPHQQLKAGQWVDIQSEWKAGIPILARIGGGVVVGKDIQTRSAGDHRFPSPNAVEDDYRAVEIFPPKGISAKTYSYTWYEDDGISAKPQISHFTLRYSSTPEQVLVDLSKDTENKFVPTWKDLSIILPAGDGRAVVMADSHVACSRSEPSRGRAVFKMVA